MFCVNSLKLFTNLKLEFSHNDSRIILEIPLHRLSCNSKNEHFLHVFLIETPTRILIFLKLIA